MSQWCYSLKNRGIGHWDVICVWLYCPPTSFHHHFLSQKSSLVPLLCFLSPLYPLGLFNAPSAFFLLLLAVLLCVSFVLFQPVFPDLMPLFFSVLCFIHIINTSFYSFIYLLHWPFAPLPIPVSVWVLCQPLCQDRSPATPASGGTERETGRAHCHCCTGVVLQLGCNL